RRSAAPWTGADEVIGAAAEGGGPLTLVRVEVDGGVAVVTLDDPDRRNALSGPMVDEIVATFDALEADESVGAVVVTGAPPAFCAGADRRSLGRAAGPGLNRT